MKRPVSLIPAAVIGIACALTVTLSGCGQKGPLYLPDQARDVVTRPAPATVPAPDEPAPDEDKDKDKNGKPPR